MKYSVLMYDDDFYRMEEYVERLNASGKFEAYGEKSLKGFLQRVKLEEFDVLVIDIQMPFESIFSEAETLGGKATGLRVLERIQENRPTVLVAALSYSELPEALEKFESESTLRYFPKELNPPRKFPVELLKFVKVELEADICEDAIFLESINNRIARAKGMVERDELRTILEDIIKAVARKNKIILGKKESLFQYCNSLTEAGLLSEQERVAVAYVRKHIGNTAIHENCAITAEQVNKMFEAIYLMKSKIE